MIGDAELAETPQRSNRELFHRGDMIGENAMKEAGANNLVEGLSSTSIDRVMVLRSSS